MARRKEKTPEYFTVEVERLDQEGRGVGHHDGKVVFIEGALPGELVTYERIRNKTSFEIGRVAQVHRESVQRVEPRCPKFGHGPGSCGGCAMQHLEPRAQVAYKERTLIDTLWHIGRVRPEQIITPIYGPFWNYRHRARLTVRDVAKKGGVLVGFHEKSSSYVAEMTGCHILTKNVSDMIMPMRELVSKLSIRQRMPQIEVAVGGNGRTALVFRTLEEPTDGDMALLNAFGAEHKADIWLQPKGPDSAHPVDPANINALGLQLPEFGVRINFKPTDFTQVNHELNETMVSRAVRLLGVEPEHKIGDGVLELLGGQPRDAQKTIGAVGKLLGRDAPHGGAAVLDALEHARLIKGLDRLANLVAGDAETLGKLRLALKLESGLGEAFEHVGVERLPEGRIGCAAGLRPFSDCGSGHDCSSLHDGLCSPIVTLPLCIFRLNMSVF